MPGHISVPRLLGTLMLKVVIGAMPYLAVYRPMQLC